MPSHHTSQGERNFMKLIIDNLCSIKSCNKLSSLQFITTGLTNAQIDTNLLTLLEIKGDAAVTIILTHYVPPFSTLWVGRFEPCLESNNSISIFTQALWGPGRHWSLSCVVTPHCHTEHQSSPRGHRDTSELATNKRGEN